MRSVGNRLRGTPKEESIWRLWYIDCDKMPILGSHTINSPTGKDSCLDLFHNGNICMWCSVWEMFHFLVWCSFNSVQNNSISNESKLTLYVPMYYPYVTPSATPHPFSRFGPWGRYWLDTIGPFQVATGGGAGSGMPRRCIGSLPRSGWNFDFSSNYLWSNETL